MMDHSTGRRSFAVGVAACAMLFSLAGHVAWAATSASDPFSALRMTRVAAVGPIEDFELNALHGGTVRSQEFAGKVILLNFWATWCGPCKEEMPSLAKLQTHFDPVKFQVVTVTTDVHPKGIKQFLDHLGLSLPVLFDENGDVSRAFMVRGLPTTVLMTQDGRAIGRAVGPRAWDGEESVALIRHLLEGSK